ncbi:SDR family NAD(P)-dependent oxidoreductase [Caulobacter sp. FWC2]|uniref:SDR family NAD(P)-dependent oxidoreductase n=1 Tax=Caulobacter sp. FWC2 TaxID=69664 RepID=UPI0018ECA888|nr:SDR family NAD(P)-dependent oxidoreductase [Caulobacter sp. FWC2]
MFQSNFWRWPRRDLARADVVINNAGVMAVGTMDTIDLDAVSYMIRVNFEAVVRSSYVFAREFRGQSSGAIINVSSISAYLISRAGGVYGGSSMRSRPSPNRCGSNWPALASRSDRSRRVRPQARCSTG